MKHGQKPAIVFDADDTTLWTYDMEVADMHFTFDPKEQDVWVQDQRFPATPGMVDFVNQAAAIGYTVFGLTGRNDDQKAATLGNLTKDGYTAFHCACVYALTGDLEEAMASLLQAQDRGFFIQSELVRNRDLDVLRGLPEFQTLAG